MLSPIAAVRTVSDKLGLETQSLASTLRHSFIGEFSDIQVTYWQRVKGASTAVGEHGLTNHYPGMYEQKLARRGLMIDENGQIVRVSEVGKLHSPYKFLLIGGSSMLEGMGPQFQSDLAKLPGMTIVREGRYSTGLNRTDYFDWFSYARELITKHKPQAIVLQFGGNDGQDIVDLSCGKKYRMDNPKWDEIYRKRIDDFMRILSTGGVKKIYWIELPIPRTDDFYRKFLQINRVQREVASRYAKVVYVETWQRFSTSNGKFASTLPDKNGKLGLVKHADGVHLTPHGARIMSDILQEYIALDIILPE